MENILDDCEPMSANDADRQGGSAFDDFDKDIESAANELEENLLGLFETASNGDHPSDSKAGGSHTDDDGLMKLDDNPFDGDIILPTVHDPRVPDPRIEQKQRDRAKRKEIRNKREAEEEEREKMQ